jgi:hypothetical protein
VSGADWAVPENGSNKKRRQTMNPWNRHLAFAMFAW